MVEQVFYLLNSQARSVVAQLDNLAPHFTGEVYLEVAYEEARLELRRQVVSHHKTARREILGGRSAENICLLALAQIAHAELASGHVHVYRGRLSGIGQGWRSIWTKAMRLSVDRGYCEPDALTQREEELRVAIAEVG